MAASRKTKKSKSGAENSARRKRKQGGTGRPFQPENIFRYPPGQSGNPGGRPKLLSDAYREWLAMPAPENSDITNAQAIAASQGWHAKYGDTQAAKELRQATEGERVVTWRDKLIDALRKGDITLKQVEDKLGGDLARELADAAGIAGSGSSEPS